MQKHRKKRYRGGRRFANANYLLPEAAQQLIRGIVDSLDGGSDFATSYLKQEFLTKFCDENLVPEAERRSRAIQKFLNCESKNRETNLWLASVDPEFNILPRVSMKSFLRFVRRFIRDILGPLSDDIVVGSFSGGASTSRPRTRSHPALKFTGKADLTEEVWKFLPIIYREMPILQLYENSFLSLREVSGSVLFTVPKKTDIDRCACKEPDVNMFLQKGVGRHIRRRLLRFGINLNDQGINRAFARDGSVTNSLATLDLSSASDLISRECVKLLLPPLWFEYLDDIRSKCVLIDGETYRLEMFSSMGNGFTFELESLIFYALMRAVSYFMNTPGVVSVYGDDIIILSENADLASYVLGRFGFTVNDDKSFISGPFRESCGGHYYNGFDVTPFYLKREATRLTDVIRVANQLRQWALRVPSRQYEVSNVYRIWCTLAALVPGDLWGGHDYSVDTQLVSPPRGSKVLVRINEPMQLDQLGSYLFWHGSNWNRTADPVGSAEPASTNQICRKRRAKPGAPVCPDWFYEELI